MAKPVVVTIAHQLGRAEAQRRLKNGFGRIGEQFATGGLAFDERWDGDRLDFSARALGQTIAGKIDVMDESVRIEVNLPWALALMAEGLQRRVSRAGRLLLLEDKGSR